MRRSLLIGLVLVCMQISTQAQDDNLTFLWLTWDMDNPLVVMEIGLDGQVTVQSSDLLNQFTEIYAAVSSPAGDQLAVAGLLDGRGKLAIINLNGIVERVLLETDVPADWTTWDRMQWEDHFLVIENSGAEILLVDLQKIPYTLEVVDSGENASISPDGNWLVFNLPNATLMNDVEVGLPISIVALHNLQSNLLGFVTVTSELQGDCRSPVWLNSTQIAYQCFPPILDTRTESQSNSPILFVTDVATFETVRYGNEIGLRCFRRLPDGETRFWRNDNELYLSKRDGVVSIGFQMAVDEVNIGNVRECPIWVANSPAS